MAEILTGLFLISSVLHASGVKVRCTAPVTTFAPTLEKILQTKPIWANLSGNRIGFALIDDASPETVLIGFTSDDLAMADLKATSCLNHPSALRLITPSSASGASGASGASSGKTEFCSPKSNTPCQDPELQQLAVATSTYIFVGSASTPLSTLLQGLFQVYQTEEWTVHPSLAEWMALSGTASCTPEALSLLQEERSVLKRFRNRVQFLDSKLLKELARELVSHRKKLLSIPLGLDCERLIAAHESREGTAQYVDSMIAVALGKQTLEKIAIDWDATYETADEPRSYIGSGAFVSYLLEALDLEKLWQQMVAGGALPIDLLVGLVRHGSLSAAQAARQHAERAATLNGTYRFSTPPKKRARLAAEVILQVLYSDEGNQLQLQAHVELTRGKRKKKQKTIADCGGEAPIQVGSLTSGRGHVFTVPDRCSISTENESLPRIELSVPEKLFDEGGIQHGLIRIDGHPMLMRAERQP